ncbi:CheR family methyltransferase [Massilia sp. YIM B02769]|uniref:CheR family methyltransferase n=1 Tax=Massilia sp. YIM B02769 TaxID=3050129 RepID=UPI0025B661F1|nr:CheR family methyltransferase [Massilia sp. YIM B02769]MDN4058413.1 CheR family methyltransferase [Massilia sp. YIM B02769]
MSEPSCAMLPPTASFISIMGTHTPDQAAQETLDNAPLSFPIVGIGASAGGLTALVDLLEHLPPAPGMAFIIVFHLPADQHSNADRVLQGSTRLPVVQVRHATPILPDHIYVVPPACSMKMENAHLVLYELDRTPGIPATIDGFFATLAMAHGARAVGVVLSGLGSDGTAGLARIKGQGGITLVQSPTDAEHSGMPQAAIDAGTADFVLAAADIPARLAALHGATQPGRGNAPDGHAGASPDLEGALHEVLSTLHEHTGHDFRQYARATLLRRLERRLELRRQPDLPSYHALQRQDPAESQALLKDLLIGVTRFFRDPAAFALLEHAVLPQIFAGKGPDDTVRVWVAACSTGEEAYSMAMLLADHAAALADPPAIQVFASDIDAQAIRTARAGLYPASIAQDLPQDRLQRYFTVENGAYKVRKALARQVLFAEHNLLRDPAFCTLDLVSCRNFLIYLNKDMHRRVLDMVHFALRPGGYLMLGSTETIDEASGLFVTVDAGMRLYRTAAAPAHQPARALPRPVEAPQAQPGMRRRSRLFSFADIHLHKIAEQAAPSILVDGNADIVHIAAEASRFLRHAGGEPTRDLVALVPPAWRLALRTALFQARKTCRETATGAVRYEENGEQRALDMRILPFHDEHAEGLLMLVSFFDLPIMPVTAAPSDTCEQPLLEQFDQELRATRRKLLDTIDQAEQSDAALRTTLEEMTTTIEALRSANRQLGASLEHAQAANRELRAANGDLAQRLDSLVKSHDDLNNLIASSDVATLFLDPHMCIERYTPRIAGLFNVIPADVGRPLQHITSRLDNPNLAEDAARVFETLQPLEQEVGSRDGQVYIVRVYPYRTGAHRIAGAVMTFFDITGRKEAEDRLRESEVLLRTLLESHAQAIWQTDAHGRVVSDSASWLAFTGQTGMEWTGEGWADALHPDDRRMALRVWRAGIAAGQVIRNRFRLRTAHGGWRWTSVLAAPVRNPDGSVRKWVGMNIDIDTEQRAADLLRASETRFRALASVGASSFYRISADWHAIHRYDGSGILADDKQPGAGWLQDCIPADERPRLRAAIARAIASRSAFAFEHRVLRPDGSVAWVASRAVPLLDDHGDILEWFGAQTDVTARVKADQAFARLFEAAPAPLLVPGTDAPRFTIRQVNSAWLAATMRTRDAILGRGIVVAYPDNPDGTGAGAAALLRASLEQVLASRQSDRLPDLRYDVARPDGSVEERWWRPVSAPVLDPDGMVEAILHHADDVTAACRAGNGAGQ